MHLNPRRILPFVVIISLVAAAFWYFWDGTAQQENGSLTASGTIEADEVFLASEAGGKVVAVYADEGEPVHAGQVLVEIDDQLLQAQLAQANAALNQAKANYDLIASGLPEEQKQLAISNANLELLSAQQALDDLYNNSEIKVAVTLQEIAQADDSIDYETKHINTLNSPADQADIDEAKADLILAQDRLDKAQDKFEPYEKKKEDNVIRATLLKRVAEAKNYYDKTVTRYNNLTGTANEIDLAIAESNLALAMAKKADAERRHELLLDGPDPNDIALAESRLDVAQANLNNSMADPSQEQLAAAQAQIESSEAAIQVLEAQLAKLALQSVMDGIVLERVIEPGEVAIPGTPLLTLAKLDDLTITVYVPENRYGEIRLGQSAQVYVDSFPGEVFTGLVVHIADQAEFTPRNVQTEEGRQTTVFAIKLNIENLEGKLKPGMPADITFSQ